MEKTCFVIMPMANSSQYEPGHFKRVYDHLLEPAVADAGFQPVSPWSDSNDLIHGRIVAELEKSTLVLCDLSTLNANVLFELGLRVAMNKPIAIVCDDKETRMPFDVQALNRVQYHSSLRTDCVERDREAIVNLVKSSNLKGNSFYKAFSIQGAASFQDDLTDQDRIEFLIRSVSELRSDARPLPKALDPDAFHVAKIDESFDGWRRSIAAWKSRVENFGVDDPTADEMRQLTEYWEKKLESLLARK